MTCSHKLKFRPGDVCGIPHVEIFKWRSCTGKHYNLEAHPNSAIRTTIDCSIETTREDRTRSKTCTALIWINRADETWAMLDLNSWNLEECRLNRGQRRNKLQTSSEKDRQNEVTVRNLKPLSNDDFNIAQNVKLQTLLTDVPLCYCDFRFGELLIRHSTYEGGPIST